MGLTEVTAINKARLIKLLNLSASDNDNEALSAIRAANRLVEGSWEWLAEQEDSPKAPRVTDARALAMIEACLGSGVLAPETTVSLMAMKIKLKKGKRLSPSEREHLASVYHKCGGVV